jgi:hypothetical protein
MSFWPSRLSIGYVSAFDAPVARKRPFVRDVQRAGARGIIKLTMGGVNAVTTAATGCATSASQFVIAWEATLD